VSEIQFTSAQLRRRWRREDAMSKAVLPQPKRKILPSLRPIFSASFKPGQSVEIARGDLTGVRGVVVKPNGQGRWLVKLEGLPAGAFLSMPREGLRPVQQRAR
jgi:hypothetical protein